MMTCRLLLLLTCLAGLQAQARATPGIEQWFSPAGNGNFSAVARNVCTPSSSASDLKFWSPDHRRKLVTRFSRETVAPLVSAVTEDGKEFIVETADWPCPELAWSPDSALFFATYSDGGAVGTFQTTAYRITAGGIEKLNLTEAVRRDFLSRYPKCYSPEEPNIAGLAWSSDSSKLLVAAEVLPHSNCDNMGSFRVYTVSVSNGRIIDGISQLAAKARLHELLGPDLRAADDGCFTHPRSCWIPGLHRTGKGK